MGFLNRSLGQDVYIVDGVRTPFLKARGVPGPFAASDLATAAGQALLNRMKLTPDAIDEVVAGCVIPKVDEVNIARVMALRMGCPVSTPAWTVQRNCASGIQAIDSAAKDIMIGRHDLVLAGGTEAMSHSPLLWSDEMTAWFASLMAAKSPLKKIQQLIFFKPRFVKPVIALLKGLCDPNTGISMGQTAEQLAFKFGIDRQQMDDLALVSHRRAANAKTRDYFKEILTLFDQQGRAYNQDDGVREDSSKEKLAKLKPFFDKRYGAVTAANSSQVTDGAAFLLLASKKAVERYQLPVLAKIRDVAWSALSPNEMGLGPVHASTEILNRQNMLLDEVDYWELNEAFAAQVLACREAWLDEAYCRTHLGLDGPMGELDMEKVNIDGGAIALGHPIGATGARIVLHLAKILQREGAQTGMATLCIGGGQGAAVLLERVEEGSEPWS